LTPPDSLKKGRASAHATVKDLKHLFRVLLEKGQSPQGADVVRRVLECASAELSMATKPAQSSSASDEQENVPGPDGFDLKHPICTTPEDFQSFEKWASTPQFKTDKEACKYKIAEPVETSDSMDDYAEYAFVVRERVKRNSDEVTPYIDIKSEGLRDILRAVLHDVKAISLIEDKPSIEQNVLFHFLPQLEGCAENIDNSSDNRSIAAQPLRLLIDHLKQSYAAISQRLLSMLQHGHITYDLLWALFKPGCYVYTTCLGTKEPRCVRFDAGEEITQNDETWWNLECRFIDYNGVKFGEAGIFLRVAKFRGSKPIESLEAFPLRYYPRHEQGSAFFMNKGKAIKVNVNSRVAVDAAFFHKMQPNYCRPSLRDLGAKDKGGIAVFDIETKSILLSLAKTRLGMIPTMPFDDVIDGKGQGFNILLNGPPGVGKTFTVKATSEYFKLPLYSISAGELVVDHGDSNALKQQLETVFKIAKHFNTVLLLDKADAFIEQRTSYHDTHNRLVTIFLRKLDRIHLIIEYENLTREFRRDLWSTFLSKARTMQGPTVVKEHELRRLETLPLNRREVNYKYLELAAESNKKFSKEFSRERPADRMYV
ncbi:hypothetical protein F1880_008444, partial [Penicillium rolfsii]